MGLGAPWDDSYLQQQIKEQSYVMFIYQYPVTNLSNLLEANQYIDDDR